MSGAGCQRSFMGLRFPLAGIDTPPTGILMLLTLGGLGIWMLIDLIFIAVGSFRDSQGSRVFRWTEPGSI